jgi:hypothetical protein
MKNLFLFVYDCSVLDVGSQVVDKINARHFKLLFEINENKRRMLETEP